VILQAGIGDVQVPELDEAQRVFSLLQHRFFSNLIYAAGG
jgi:hypothetical protein